MEKIYPFDPLKHPVAGVKARYCEFPENDCVIRADDFHSFSEYTDCIDRAAADNDTPAEECISVLLHFGRVWFKKNESTIEFADMLMPLARNFPNAKRLTLRFNYITHEKRDIETLDFSSLSPKVENLGLFCQQMRAVKSISFRNTSIACAVVEPGDRKKIALVPSAAMKWVCVPEGVAISESGALEHEKVLNGCRHNWKLLTPATLEKSDDPAQ